MISLGEFQAMYTLAIEMKRISEIEETANNNGDHFVNDKLLELINAVTSYCTS